MMRLSATPYTLATPIQGFSKAEGFGWELPDRASVMGKRPVHEQLHFPHCPHLGESLC